MTNIQLKPISLYDLLVNKEELWTSNALNDGDFPEYIVKALNWVKSHYDEKEVNHVASKFADHVDDEVTARWGEVDAIDLEELGDYANEMGMVLNYECYVPYHIQVEISVPTQSEEEVENNPYRDGWIIIRAIDNIDEDEIANFYPDEYYKPVAKIIYAGRVTLYTKREQNPDGTSHYHYSIEFPDGPDNEIDFGKCHAINTSTALDCRHESTDTITFDFVSVNETENRPEDLITILEICDCIDY